MLLKKFVYGRGKVFSLVILLSGTYSLFMHGHLRDDLERAIQDSDLSLVQIVLPKLKLSEQEKCRFVSLADDVLCYRRNGTILHSANPDIGTPEIPIILLGFISFIGGGIVMLVDIESNEQVKYRGPALAIAGWLTIAGGIIYGLKRRYKKFNELYRNALKIKQLILQV